jgi:MerR family transcriptional regulator, thiopeptide resistance regulator
MTVGKVARSSGLTVRTLHYFDSIGLVVPRARSEAGYRLYARADIERLQEVLFFRELGFGLEEIKAILDRPDYSRGAVLRRQRRLLQTRVERAQRMIEAVDAALEGERMNLNLTNEEMLDVFGDFDPTEHEEEAEERWGDTDAYNESAHRVAKYAKKDWLAISAEASAINEAFIALMREGASPVSSEAREISEQHRAHISKWFYECSPEMHAALGQMYVADERFTRNIDAAADGLAAYMAEAFEASAKS